MVTSASALDTLNGFNAQYKYQSRFNAFTKAASTSSKWPFQLYEFNYM